MNPVIVNVPISGAHFCALQGFVAAGDAEGLTACLEAMASEEMDYISKNGLTLVSISPAHLGDITEPTGDDTLAVQFVFSHDDAAMFSLRFC